MTDHDTTVTFLNVFEIPREDIATFTAGWEQRIALVRDAPGFRGARLLEAVSSAERFQLVNVTEWDSEQAWRAATASPALAASVRAAQGDAAQRATPNPGLYRVAAVDAGEGPLAEAAHR